MFVAQAMPPGVQDVYLVGAKPMEPGKTAHSEPPECERWDIG
jgi:hypothetical protein